MGMKVFTGVRRMNKYTRSVVFALLGTGVVACSPGNPEETGALTPKGSAAPLTQKEYESLTPLQRYKVANKLMGTFFKGVSADEFFVPSSITRDEATLVTANAADNYVNTVKDRLNIPLQDTQKTEIYNTIVGIPVSEDNPVAIPGKYVFTDSDVRIHMEFPSAYIYELPLSNEFFARWMAYKLTNTILFSAGEEIDSADELDVQIVYEELSSAILNDVPIRSIIFAHETSRANWRRFRSPEDNTREMIEIYLGLFDRDEDVPRASRACRNWSLTDENAGYELVVNQAFENDEPQLVFDSVYVRTCEDFFRAVSDHPLVIPRIATVLVDHLLEVTSDPVVRANLVTDVVRANPTTFREMFEIIIFSKTYLLNVERPMWAEEVFYNTAAKVQWTPFSGFFRDFNRSASRGEPGSIDTSLALMYQPAFSLKLGRFPVIPQDALGSAYLHRAVRDSVMMRCDICGDGWGWSGSLVNNRGSIELEDFISYLFVNTIARYPTQDELDTLMEVINSAEAVGGGSLNIAGSLREKARVVLDYLARLPESYYFTAVN